jgi:hypothetical protein
LEARLELNPHHQAILTEAIASGLKVANGFEVTCGDLDHDQIEKCFLEIKALGNAYEAGLVRPNSIVGPIARIEIWSYGTDVVGAGQQGVVIRSRIGKTSQDWADLINGYLNGGSQQLRVQRLDRLSSIQDGLESTFRKPIHYSEVYDGVYGLRSWQQMTPPVRELALQSLKQAGELIQIKLGALEKLNLSLIDGIQIASSSKGVIESNGQWFLSLGSSESPSKIAAEFLKVHVSNLETQQKRAEFLLYKKQYSEILERLVKAFPSLQIDCELQTDRGEQNISMRDCVIGLTQLESALAEQPLKTPLFEAISIGNYGIWSLGVSDGTLHLRHDSVAMRMRENLVFETKEFNDLVKEIDANNPMGHSKL